VSAVRHAGGRVREVLAATPAGERAFPAGAVVSTIPLPALARLLDPPPPAAALEAAAGLGFRDLILAAVAADRPSITDQSWIYLPDRTVPFGRLHEPKNWSPAMAPAGRSLVVAEWFCSRGDAVWEAADASLAERTLAGLERLGYLGRDEAAGVRVLRVPAAYPLFDVGYEGRAAAVRAGLAGVGGLGLAGRSGCFAYQNMDHAIRSGLDAARALLGAGGRP
jgi:protoporphyrinogen oxidase